MRLRIHFFCDYSKAVPDGTCKACSSAGIPSNQLDVPAAAAAQPDGKTRGDDSPAEPTRRNCSLWEKQKVMKRWQRAHTPLRTNSELTNLKAMTKGQWSLGTLSLGARGASGLNLWNGTTCKRE